MVFSSLLVFRSLAVRRSTRALLGLPFRRVKLPIHHQLFVSKWQCSATAARTFAIDELAEYVDEQINGTFCDLRERLVESAGILGYESEESMLKIPLDDSKLIVEDAEACPESLDHFLNDVRGSHEIEQAVFSNESASTLEDVSCTMSEIGVAFADAKGGQSHRVTGLIKKHGIHVPRGGGKGTKYELLAYDASTKRDGQKLVLGTNSTINVQRTVRQLVDFIRKHQCPGMVKCDKCRTWWNECQDVQHHSVDIGGCHGFCDRARKSNL